MSIRLKPCPKCGNTDIYGRLCGGNAAYGVGEYEYEVECPCGILFTDQVDGPNKEAKERGIAEWNTRAERTCHYFPGDELIGFDGDGNKVETGEADLTSDYSCSECGYTMLGGDSGWFDGSIGEHGGLSYEPKFNYCPSCGARVVR